jgi:sugar lactone lactonase YvrE
VIPLSAIETVGLDLARPECVLCTANGRAYVSDWGGGVTVIEPDGSQWRLLARDAGFEVQPNGITLMADGSLLLSHLGPETGGVFRLDENRQLTPFLLEADGLPLPPTNYAHLDHEGRVWVTVSTRLVPRARGYRGDVADGFIVLVDRRGARIVADGLGYTNECIVHPDGKRLFVNETFSRRLSCFDITAAGDLVNRRRVTEFDSGTFPDGLAFDSEGGAWITSIVSNRVIRIAPRGSMEVVVEDNDAQHLEWVEAAYLDGSMGRPHLDNVNSRKLRNISSLAFAGPDLKTAYLGCLLGDSIYRFPAPVAGHPPAHWSFAGPRRQE